MSDARRQIVEQLIAMSHQLGREASKLAILAEGNTSARLDNHSFVVKASGANLATLEESAVIECRFAPLLALLDGGDVDDSTVEHALLDARVDASAKKPSVEAVFHAMLLTLPGVSWIGHTHPNALLGILCSPAAERFAVERRFPDEIVCCGERSPLVPYVDPGVPLARAIACEARKHVDQLRSAPRTILLENHGLIALGSSPGSVIAATLMSAKSAEVFLAGETVGGARALPPEQVRRISGRPDEHYRQRELQM